MSTASQVAPTPLNIPIIKQAFKALRFEDRVSLCDEQGVHFAYLEAVLMQPGDQQSTFTAEVFKQLVKRAAIRWPHLAFTSPAPMAQAGEWASLPSDFQAVLHLDKSAQTLTKLVGVLDRLPKSMVRKMSADAEEAMFNARNEAINLAAAIKPVIAQLNASATKLMEGAHPSA